MHCGHCSIEHTDGTLVLTFTHVRGGCSIHCIRLPCVATGVLIGLELGWKCVGRGARAFRWCNGVLL